MAKPKGFFSQDVEVERRETPDSPIDTRNLPPSWLPLADKILRWYDQLQYPVITPFGVMGKRKAKQTRRDNTWITEIKTAWAAVAAGTKANWKTAAAFVKRNGYQLFVKDYAYRKRNHLSLPGTPNVLHQVKGLLMSNPGPVAQCRLQRDDVQLTGQVTLSFNYKKTENVPTGGDPFNFLATLWYFKGGQILTETHTWSAPAGNVAWASVSETYGTAGRKYFHHRVIFYLDNYDADVYFANFLLQDQTLAWTVTYNATVLPENASPVWTKTGSVTTEKIRGDRLNLAEPSTGALNVTYSRVPFFNNVLGSTVEFRLKIEEGTEKESGDDQYTARVVHSDGARRVEYLFFQNGIIFNTGSEYEKYHYDTTRYRTYRSFIRGSRLYFYIGRTLAYRKVLAASAVQIVRFGHYGRSGFDTESRWGWVKYYQGKDEAPGEDILREGWWIKAGKEWEVDTLYRKTGWTFTPEYHVPYFNVVYLT